MRSNEGNVSAANLVWRTDNQIAMTKQYRDVRALSNAFDQLTRDKWPLTAVRLFDNRCRDILILRQLFLIILKLNKTWGKRRADFWGKLQVLLV